MGNPNSPEQAILDVEALAHKCGRQPGIVEIKENPVGIGDARVLILHLVIHIDHDAGIVARIPVTDVHNLRQLARGFRLGPERFSQHLLFFGDIGHHLLGCPCPATSRISLDQLLKRLACRLQIAKVTPLNLSDRIEKIYVVADSRIFLQDAAVGADR
jgi:hypothetical protein